MSWLEAAPSGVFLTERVSGSPRRASFPGTSLESSILRRRQAMRAASPLTLKTMAGAAAPGRPFDPLGVANICDVRLLREAELKHGRIAMLASVGFVVPDLGLRLPGVTLSSLDAHDALIAASPNGGAMGQILLFVSLLEALVGVPAVVYMLGGGDREPGDFNFDPFGLAGPSAAEVELTNARLAMLSFGAIATQAALGHPSFPYAW